MNPILALSNNRKAAITNSLRCALATLLVAAILASATTKSPSAPLPNRDKIRIERLAGLGRLWGTIRYFHPYLAYRDIDWDAALVAAIPKVRAARTSEDYRAAIDGLLASLGDPTTQTARHIRARQAAPTGEAEPTAAPENFYQIVDDNLVLNCRGLIEHFYRDADAPQALRTAREKATGNGIVFDCRHGTRDNRIGLNAGEYAGYADLLLREQLTQMLDKPLALGTYRYREHSGFAPQTGNSPEGYSSRLVTEAPFVLNSKQQGGRQPAFSFIIDAATPDLHELMGGLQSAGLATIVEESNTGMGASERGPIRRGRAVHTVSLPGGIDVYVRIAEFVSPLGEVDFKPDVEVMAAPADGTDPALAAAIANLHTLHRATPTAVVPLRPRAERDRPYAEMAFPTVEYRLLALFRYWNVIEYFYPYKHLMDRNWADALPEFIAKFEANQSELDYQRSVIELGARLPDAHVTTDNADAFLRDLGRFAPPIVVETVENQTVIVELRDQRAAQAANLRIGDVILAVDDEPIEERRARMAPFIGASTPQALQRRIDGRVLRGARENPARLRVRGADGAREVEIERSSADTKVAFSGRRSAPAVFGTLPSGYGYIDIDRLTEEDTDKALDAVLTTPALILDMRGYPRGAPLDLGLRLAKDRRAIRGPIFRRPTWSGRMLGEYDPLRPALTYQQSFQPSQKKPYQGVVVMLIDEHAISSAEHVCLIFAAATNVTFIGASTLGTDGDTVTVVLPGNLVVHFTGEEVLKPDGGQFQRVGVQPHVRVDRTVEGVREGRDEILEAAIGWLDAHVKN
jgi:C-terminal processing protease CtpA/Prc